MKDFLLLATSLGVRGIPLNISLQEDIILPLSGLGTSFSGSAVEFDGPKETLFYNDRSRGLVYKSNLNGTGDFFPSFFQFELKGIVMNDMLREKNVQVVAYSCVTKR